MGFPEQHRLARVVFCRPAATSHLPFPLSVARARLHTHRYFRAGPVGKFFSHLCCAVGALSLFPQSQQPQAASESLPAVRPLETGSSQVFLVPFIPPWANPLHMPQPLQMAPCYFRMCYVAGWFRVPGRFKRKGGKEKLAKGDLGSL